MTAAVEQAPQGGQVSAGGLIAFAVIVAVIWLLFWVHRHGWAALRKLLRGRTSDTSGRPDMDMSGHDVRRSDAVDTPDPGPPVDTSDINVWGDLEKVGWVVEPDTTRPRVTIPRRPTAGTATTDVAPRAVVDQPPRRACAAERQRWLQERMQPGDPIGSGKSIGQIDAIAADLFEVEERTLRRDRKAIKTKAGRANR